MTLPDGAAGSGGDPPAPAAGTGQELGTDGSSEQELAGGPAVGSGGTPQPEKRSTRSSAARSATCCVCGDPAIIPMSTCKRPAKGKDDAHWKNRDVICLLCFSNDAKFEKFKAKAKCCLSAADAGKLKNSATTLQRHIDLDAWKSAAQRAGFKKLWKDFGAAMAVFIHGREKKSASNAGSGSFLDRPEEDGSKEDKTKEASEESDEESETEEEDDGGDSDDEDSDSGAEGGADPDPDGSAAQSAARFLEQGWTGVNFRESVTVEPTEARPGALTLVDAPAHATGASTSPHLVKLLESDLFASCNLDASRCYPAATSAEAGTSGEGGAAAAAPMVPRAAPCLSKAQSALESAGNERAARESVALMLFLQFFMVFDAEWTRFFRSKVQKALLETKPSASGADKTALTDFVFEALRGEASGPTTTRVRETLQQEGSGPIDGGINWLYFFKLFTSKSTGQTEKKGKLPSRKQVTNKLGAFRRLGYLLLAFPRLRRIGPRMTPMFIRKMGENKGKTEQSASRLLDAAKALVVGTEEEKEKARAFVGRVEEALAFRLPNKTEEDRQLPHILRAAPLPACIQSAPGDRERLLDEALSEAVRKHGGDPESMGIVEKRLRQSMLVKHKDIIVPHDFVGYDDIVDNLLLKFDPSRDKKHEHLDLPSGKPRYACLLYGSPGTGKSLLAKTIAKKLGFSLLEFDSTFQSMWQGNSEATVKTAMEFVRLAREIVFFVDEADTIFCSTNRPNSSMDQAVTIFATRIQEIKNEAEKIAQEREKDGRDAPVGPIFIFATNFPKELQGKLFRRMELKHYMRPPSPADVTAFIEHFITAAEQDALCTYNKRMQGEDPNWQMADRRPAPLIELGPDDADHRDRSKYLEELAKQAVDRGLGYESIQKAIMDDLREKMQEENLYTAGRAHVTEAVLRQPPTDPKGDSLAQCLAFQESLEKAAAPKKAKRARPVGEPDTRKKSTRANSQPPGTPSAPAAPAPARTPAGPLPASPSRRSPLPTPSAGSKMYPPPNPPPLPVECPLDKAGILPPQAPAKPAQASGSGDQLQGAGTKRPGEPAPGAKDPGGKRPRTEPTDPSATSAPPAAPSTSSATAPSGRLPAEQAKRPSEGAAACLQAPPRLRPTPIPRPGAAIGGEDGAEMQGEAPEAAPAAPAEPTASSWGEVATPRTAPGPQRAAGGASSQNGGLHGEQRPGNGQAPPGVANAAAWHGAVGLFPRPAAAGPSPAAPAKAPTSAPPPPEGKLFDPNELDQSGSFLSSSRILMSRL
eukprot:tig00021046_g17792.t1